MKTPMRFQVALETDPDSGHVLGSVLGIPEIVVDGATDAQVLDDLRTAIRMALDDPVLGERARSARLMTVDV
jgi:hypothetical protein